MNNNVKEFFGITKFELIEHVSYNKHWIVILLSKEKMFLKEFLKFDKFKNETTTLQDMGFKFVTYEHSSKYYILMGYLELKKIDSVSKSNVNELSLLIANFHNHYRKKPVDVEYYIETFLIKSNFEYLNKYRVEIISSLKTAKIELSKIHGDLGLRNIFLNVDTNKLCLIDYERSEYKLLEEDFIKLFYKDIKHKTEREIFINKYFEQTNYKIETTSINWKIALYRTIAGIESYLINFESKELTEIKIEIKKDLDELMSQTKIN